MLKALPLSLGKPAFGHDLRTLGAEAEKICGDLPRDVWRCLLILDRMYIPSRHPNAFSSGAAYEHFSREDA